MALFILFLGSFCLGTAEFMATGLLPQVAADLRISIPTAGTIVTAYALGVAFGGPILALLLGRMARKTVLIGLIALFAAAQSAPNLASSLISTAFNIGIAGGAFIGAMLLSSGVSYADIPAVGVVTSLLAAGTASLSWWLERRRSVVAA